MIRHRHPPHHALEIGDVIQLHDRPRRARARARPAFHDLQFFLLRGVVHKDHEHEPVELRLGQRISALLLDGVLRREDEKGLGQFVAHAAHRHAPLLHRLEHRGLRFRRRAVDLVRQNHVRKNRPVEELELPLAGLRILIDDLRARDVARHQVGRELDALERQIDRLRQRGDEQRFRQPRHAHEQCVAPRENRDQHFVDHLVLSDDDLRELMLDQPVRLLEIRHRLDVIFLESGCVRVGRGCGGFLGGRRGGSAHGGLKGGG